MSETLDRLTSQFPRDGQIVWLGVRTDRKQMVQSVQAAEILMNGLVGDHRGQPGKRAVTLIQSEHLATIATLAGQNSVDPADLRRNIVVSGINLLALRRASFRVGTAFLRGTGPCAPCSRMEAVLGPGGFNAMRGHGGLTAEVLEPGTVRIGDALRYIPD